MNNYDEMTNVIEEINIKLKEIDKQMIIVEEIKPQFGAMDTFIPELEAAYKDFEESLSNGILRTQTLNKIVTDDAINGYYDIYQELNSKCKNIMDDLLESVKVVNTPTEVLEITPPTLTTHELEVKELDPLYQNPIITDDFINRQISLIKPIDKIGNPRDVIPVPQPIKPEIEVLEM